MINFKEFNKILLYEVNISDLENSRFKFYLNDTFRKEIFQRLKKKYKKWNMLTKEFGVNQRALFGLRRGYNYEKGEKVLRFIRCDVLFRLCQLLNKDIDSIQDNVRMIEIGNRKENITFPLKVSCSEDINNLKRNIADFVYSANYEGKLKYLKQSFDREKYLVLDFNHIKNFFYAKIEKMRLQGLKPQTICNSKFIKVSYRVPGTNERTTVILPKKIVFDENFAKEFGKWMGDRAGGPHKVGVSNKEIKFIDTFKIFLSNTLLQPTEQIKITLSVKPNFIPSKELISYADKVEICKTQYGNFGFSAIVANKLLRNLIFDELEKCWFEVLCKSRKEVRFAFYAGLLEAEGSIDGKTINWAFGLNLQKEIDNEAMISLLKKATKFKFLLERDGFDSILSRKLSVKHKILKYDVKIFRNYEQREIEVDLFKCVIKYLNHPIKLSKSEDLIHLIKNGGKQKMVHIDNRLVPEVNIGTLGH